MKTQLIVTSLIAAAIAAEAAGGPLDPPLGAPGGHGPVKVLVKVSSRGLDLTSEAGADQFLARLNAMVNRACDDRPTDGPMLALARSPGFYACRSEALQTAMTYVHSPIVRRRYAAMEAEGGLHVVRR
jgi:UrcA family protein